VRKPTIVRTLRDKMLDAYLRDNVKARRMQTDGSYIRVQAEKGKKAFSAQEHLLKTKCSRT
jgi:polyphosphate kinase